LFAAIETGTGRDSFFRSAENSSEGIAGNVTPIVKRRRQMERSEEFSMDDRLAAELPGRGADLCRLHPEKFSIGVMYQNDDFGKDYVIGLHEGLGDQANKLIVVEASYETTSPTVDSQVVQIRTANPDIFINISTPKFAAQAIKKIGELKWNPVHFLTNVSVSVGSVMKPAGYENGQGILSAAYLKDPKDPQWKNDPAMNEWRAFMTKWYPEGDQEDAATVFAYGIAKGLEQVLKQCKDDLTRVMLLAVLTTCHPPHEGER
jgi:ABC-type branched-subunit amino acid transport system substrate-binding protein